MDKGQLYDEWDLNPINLISYNSAKVGSPTVLHEKKKKTKCNSLPHYPISDNLSRTGPKKKKKTTNKEKNKAHVDDVEWCNNPQSYKTFIFWSKDVKSMCNPIIPQYLTESFSKRRKKIMITATFRIACSLWCSLPQNKDSET